MILLCKITYTQHTHTPPNGQLQMFISYCTCDLCPLLLDARSRRASPICGDLFTATRALCFCDQSARVSRALRRTIPNQSGERRRSGARARLPINRRPRGARGRALEKNLKRRELSTLLLRLVTEQIFQKQSHRIKLCMTPLIRLKLYI